MYVCMYVLAYVHECVSVFQRFLKKIWRIYRCNALLICNKNGVIFRLVLLLIDKLIIFSTSFTHNMMLLFDLF